MATVERFSVVRIAEFNRTGQTNERLKHEPQPKLLKCARKNAYVGQLHFAH